MSESKQRQFHTPELKAKVGLEAIRGIKTLNEIALEFGVHPVQVGQWMRFPRFFVFQEVGFMLPVSLSVEQ